MGNKEEAKIDGVSDEVDKLSNKVNLSLCPPLVNCLTFNICTIQDNPLNDNFNHWTN